MKEKGKVSMLHFELYKAIPAKSSDYLGGNWFGNTKPKDLLNPVQCLKSTLTGAQINESSRLQKRIYHR